MSRFRTPVAVATLALVAAGLPLLTVTQASAAGPVYKQWDFNSDGNADLAVGAPGEDLGTVRDAGQVNVFMANSTTGAYSTSTPYTQAVRGAPESGDQFGYALTSGDYDGDGYADLAIAANKEDYGSGSALKHETGNVTVLWGSATGLTTASPAVIWFTAAYSYGGDAMASGDMNGDGIDELAVGLPGVEVIKIFKGGARATFGATSLALSQVALPGTKRVGDLFGEAMVMGNFDNDAYMDLVVGAPFDSQDTGYSVGSIVVIPGGTAVANTARAHYYSPSANLVANAHTFTVNDEPDSFGRTLAAGDFNDDSFDDLAVGIPGTPVGSAQDAGALSVIYGSATGITATGNKVLTENSADVKSTSTKGGLWTASLAAGHRVGKTDLLAVGSAKENAYALPGASGAGSDIYTQTLTAGVWGDRVTGNAFGAFVRFLDNKNTGNESLAISAPGVEGSSGAIFVLPSTGTLLTGSGSWKSDETTDTAAGGKEAGDSWGWLGDSH